MNENLIKWLTASFAKHFEVLGAGDDLFFLEGEPRDTQRSKTPIFELRVDGPYLTESTKNNKTAYCEVSVLVQTPMDSGDDVSIYIHPVALGKAAALFDDISIYKYGDGNIMVGCAQLLQSGRSREKVQVNNFGQVEPEKMLMQGSVEGHYQFKYNEGEI